MAQSLGDILVQGIGLSVRDIVAGVPILMSGNAFGLFLFIPMGGLTTGLYFTEQRAEFGGSWKRFWLS